MRSLLQCHFCMGEDRKIEAQPCIIPQNFLKSSTKNGQNITESNNLDDFVSTGILGFFAPLEGLFPES
jgi:hypothetical protein